jgi:hypothetical protein
MKVSDVARSLGNLCATNPMGNPSPQENLLEYLGFVLCCDKDGREVLSTRHVEHAYVSDWLQSIIEYLMSDTPESNFTFAHIACNSEVMALLTEAATDRKGFSDAVCRVRGAP